MKANSTVTLNGQVAAREMTQLAKARRVESDARNHGSIHGNGLVLIIMVS